MPQVCKTCLHPERHRLEAQAIAGATPSALSSRFGIPRKSIKRHMAYHATRDLAQAMKDRNGKAGASLLEEIEDTRQELVQIGNSAKAADEWTAAVNACMGRLRSSELRGRATGEIASGGSVTIINQLGVRIDQAKQAVEAVRDAQSIPQRTVVERAAEVLRLWNASCDPGEQVEVTVRREAESA